MALVAARLLPRPIMEKVAVGLALAYHARNRIRREIVIQNLLPALDFNRAAAERTCRRLFRQFGLKLSDLWRYEAGCAMEDPEVAPDQWRKFEEAQAKGRGILLLTPHLGNWEFGAPFLRKRGVSLQVITQAEPQDSLTEIRKASRARWGIETLVIGENPFAFIEVIRRLEGGAAIALLIDRPPVASAVTVTLFGQSFAASIAPAELARAAGCALLPVWLPRINSRYEVKMLNPVSYDRRELGTREARIQFTQEILDLFAPAIQSHIDQWFHFIPLWRSNNMS